MNKKRTGKGDKARRGARVVAVDDLKPGREKNVRAGFTKKVDKASPTL